MRVKTALESFDVLSVTSHRYSTWNFRSDGDLTAEPQTPANPFARLIGLTDESVRTIAQEFRLNSRNPGGLVNWSMGFFGARTTMNFDAVALIYPTTESPFFPLRHSRSTNADVAAFGELRLAVTDRLTIIPGLRYEWAGRDASNLNGSPFITSASSTFDKVLPSIAAVYAPISTLSTFAKYTQGFKPGGFIADRSTVLIDEFRFKTETSDNYEIGFKSTFLGNRVVLNGSLFYSDYRNYQVITRFSASDFGVNNAQKVRAFGGELEGSYYVVPQTRLFFGVGGTDSRFVDFRNGFGTFTGNQVSFVPQFTFNYGAEYRADWGGYAIVSARTFGNYYLDSGNANKQSGLTVVNATLGMKKGSFDIALFGRNIFNEKYVVSVYDFAGTGVGAFGSLADPATFGVRSRVTF